MNESDSDPKRPARVAAQARIIAEYFGERRQYHSDRAAEFGYAKEVLEGAAGNLALSSDSPLIAGTEVALTKFDLFVRSKEGKVEDYRVTLPSTTYALGSSVVANVSASLGVTLGVSVTSLIQQLKAPDPPLMWTWPRIREYSDKLLQFDSELARVYESVWKSFYGDPDSGERNSLFLMRQLFDHLFSILAPDDKVRMSPHFKEKEGDKPQAVHRGERLAYAASVHVLDSNLADVLVSEASNVLALYDELNRAHTRGPLDHDRTKYAITAMYAVVESWVDAIKVI